MSVKDDQISYLHMLERDGGSINLPWPLTPVRWRMSVKKTEVTAMDNQTEHKFFAPIMIFRIWLWLVFNTVFATNTPGG